MLIEHGFEGGAFFALNDVPDEALAVILEYYALDAGERCTKQAKFAYRQFAKVGIRITLQTVKGYIRPGVEPSAEPGITKTKILDAMDFIKDTLGEREAKDFARANIKVLYSEMVFPEAISANGKIERHGSVDEERLTRETYVLKRVHKAHSEGKGVTIKQLYDGIRANKHLQNQSTRALKRLDRKSVV